MKVHAPLGLLLASLILFSACATPNPEPTPKPATPDSTASQQKPALRAIDADLMVFINGRAITVALADEPREHTRGLSGVSRLSDDEGMLFVYPESERRSFWMKGCLIPLDIAFLDDEGVIQEIFTLRPPRPSEDIDLVPRANSKAPSRFVLEMRGNFFRDYGITPGTKVAFDRSLGKDRALLTSSAGSILGFSARFPGPQRRLRTRISFTATGPLKSGSPSKWVMEEGPIRNDLGGNHTFHDEVAYGSS